MRVRVLFFASTRDIVGARALHLELAPQATVSILLQALVAAHPGLAGLSESLQVAVNEEYADRSLALAEGDEVALIPPVSGGAQRPPSGHPAVIRIVERTIDPAELHEVVRAPSDGAVVTFSGVVREECAGRPTSHLVYEAYAPMAERKMRELAAEARNRWPLGEVAILHRVGRLEIGEISVLIGVASPHRAAAFDGCRYLIDRLKEVVPIWKKEFGPDGQYWVEGPVPAGAGRRRG